MASPTEIQECDTLCETAKYTEEFEKLSSLSSTNPNDVELMWRLARCYFDLAEMKTDLEWRKKNFFTGFEIIQKALTVNDQHFAVHKWMAILLSSVGNFQETKVKIGNSYKIKEHALTAAKLNPKDSNTQHVLGKWCYTIADIDFITRTAASALFSTPPTSSFEEALSFFLKAEELGGNIRNKVALGDTCMKLKKKEDAKEWYQKAIDATAVSEVDKIAQEDAKTKLASAKSSWW